MGGPKSPREHADARITVFISLQGISRYSETLGVVQAVSFNSLMYIHYSGHTNYTGTLYDNFNLEK